MPRTAVPTENNNEGPNDNISNLLKQLLNKNWYSTKDIHFLTKKVDKICIQVNEFTQICKDKKTAEELAKLMTIDELLEKHNVKEVLDPTSEDPLSKPVFCTIASFQSFDVHQNFMKNTTFLEDLEKYFHTVIDVQKHPKDEIKKLLKIFFHKRVLYENYTGDCKKGDKQIFKETNFNQMSRQSLIKEYNDKDYYYYSTQRKD